MRRHSSVKVKVNAKIPDGGNRQNGNGANSDWHSQDLMLTTTGRAPKDFSLGGVELQPIDTHPDDISSTRTPGGGPRSLDPRSEN